MPALAAANVTVAVPAKYARFKESGRLHVYGTIAFGDGALTYPTAGIPLPAIGQFGMKVRLEALDFYGVNERTTDYMLRYNKAAHKLQLFDEEAVAAGGPLLEALTSEAPPARTYDFHAMGW